MLTLLITVFVTSLLGSLHCAGMCGPFVLFCTATENQKLSQHAMTQLAYHSGRLISYAILGIIAGFIGSALDEAGSLLGIQRVAMIAAGVLMLLFGIIALLRIWGMRIPKMNIPEPIHKFFLRGQSFAKSRHPVTRAWLIGLLSILLPCGWLYLYVFAAAGTGSGIYGGLTLIAFWLGTVPTLAAVGFGAQTILAPIRKHVPTIMAMILIAAGSLVVFRGINRTTTPPDRTTSDTHSTQEAMQRVEGIKDKDTVPACCSDGIGDH